MTGHGSPPPEDQANHPARKVGMRNVRVTKAGGFSYTAGAISHSEIERIQAGGGQVAPLSTAAAERRGAFSRDLKKAMLRHDYEMGRMED